MSFFGIGGLRRRVRVPGCTDIIPSDLGTRKDIVESRISEKFDSAAATPLGLNPQDESDITPFVI
jgi:hypothetical protein